MHQCAGAALQQNNLQCYTMRGVPPLIGSGLQQPRSFWESSMASAYWQPTVLIGIRLVNIYGLLRALKGWAPS